MVYILERVLLRLGHLADFFFEGHARKQLPYTAIERRERLLRSLVAIAFVVLTPRASMIAGANMVAPAARAEEPMKCRRLILVID